MGRCDGLRRTLLPKIIVFYVLGPIGNLVFSLLLGPINRTLEGWDSLPLLQLLYAIPILGLVSHKLNFHSNNQIRKGWH
jgi:hypothetical protein